MDSMGSSVLKGSLLAELVSRSGLLDLAWSKIPKPQSTYSDKDSALGLGIKVYPEAKYTVVVFMAPPLSGNNSFRSAASTLLSGPKNTNPFHFLCTRISSFSVHTPAFQLFASAFKDFPKLKNELLQSSIHYGKPVIITGAALGGSVASLFTLWLLETINSRQEKPLCITFGSPLIGDVSLQQILKNSKWESCFLHVVDVTQSPITAGFFKPFGTFLICLNSQCICIDEPEAVMELLSSIKSDLVDWRDYGKVLHRLNQSAWSMVEMSLSDDVIYRMEKQAKTKKLRFDQHKKLSSVRKSLMYIDYYRLYSKKNKIGYYDYFKTQTVLHTPCFCKDIVKLKKKLNDFWVSVVEEIEKAPGEIWTFQRRYYLFGNNYRRLIEPLDIAEYYISGGKDYRTLGRSHHYIMLEKWFGMESISPFRPEKRDLNTFLTLDSCFWAEVEEAIITINLLKTHEGMRDEASTQKLLLFEEYVWETMVKREVSPEIFLEKSSFMRWWKEYKEIKKRDGSNSSPSNFTQFMNNGMYWSYGLLYSLAEVNGASYPVYLEDPCEEMNLTGPPPSLADSEDYDFGSLESGLELAIDDGKSSYQAATEMTGETECMLVFSCNDNLEVDEISFIEAISKELHNRGVISLTYNLLGRENLDEAMLDKSSVGIIILSNSYACSGESLDHLVEIMEYGRATNLVIIPIYFKVTHAEICGSEGPFEAAFLQSQNSVQADRAQKWKTAITEIASNSGYEWTKGTELKLAEEVVGNACLRLYLKNSENMVRILALLKHSQPSDADFVGLWGMAGIGKTAIAREVYEILASQYDLSYFQKDFDKKFQDNGLRQMRDDFFSKVFGEEKLSISACDIKPRIMRNWFHKKTILVVLDDVSNARDVEAVVGGFDWFSPGHRIILTSRRKQVLVQCKVQEPYEIQKLCETESFRLCKQYWSGESVLISDLVISYSSGIPLALEVLASSVSKLHHINDMLERLQTLRTNPPTELQETFQRSFKGLDENEKNIFLDLACFFRGEKMDHVVQLLDACGFRTYLGIYGLMDESLISLVDNRIEMPIPFQDIGQFIVREEYEDISERSRLWDSEDIIDVFTNGSGTDATEGIFLDMSDLTWELSPIVFCEMYRLRLLKFYCSTSGKKCKLSLPKGLDSLPDELRLLHWENYPLENLPQKFNPKNLVELNMPYSNMDKLWEGKKNLEKLKKITLSHSKSLTDIQMLSEALNLEHIDLEGCTSLVDVSTSIPRCGKLVSFNMKDCSQLQSLSPMVDLTSLKLLNLSGCSKLEKIQDFAPNLEELYLAETVITELPLSIGNLTELVTLDLENCKRLQQLPFGIKNSRSIVNLTLFGCTSLESLPEVLRNILV